MAMTDIDAATANRMSPVRPLSQRAWLGGLHLLNAPPTTATAMIENDGNRRCCRLLPSAPLASERIDSTPCTLNAT